jgi:hypothetical protein
MGFLDFDPHNLPYIINHVFLPPKLPQKADDDVFEGSSSLLKTILHVANNYHEKLIFSTEAGECAQWMSAVQMLATMRELESTNSPSNVFSKAVMRMKAGGMFEELHNYRENY